MSNTSHDAYCFFRQIEPRQPLVARFDYDYLLHAVEGALDVEINGRRWILPRSFAAWVPAETEIKVVLDRPVTSCSILSRPGFVLAFPDHPVVFQMSRMTREMAHHCRDWGKDAGHPPDAPVFFQALLTTCAGLVGASVDVARPSSDDPQVAKVIGYLEGAFNEVLTADAVAAACGLSVRTLQRKCASELGESWRHTLVRIRMIHAVDCLTTDTRPIIQIAGECGYSSVSAFNQSFKAFAGMTPTEFRRRVS
ncbi:helix-turn-helix domain-containing protein [Roseobacteraceae bacterium S113]